MADPIDTDALRAIAVAGKLAVKKPCPRCGGHGAIKLTDHAMFKALMAGGMTEHRCIQCAASGKTWQITTEDACAARDLCRAADEVDRLRVERDALAAKVSAFLDAMDSLAAAHIAEANYDVQTRAFALLQRADRDLRAALLDEQGDGT